jgi:hypothetical protein
MAGTLVIDQIQLGDNATASENFVIQTLNDGTMKIQRGTIGGTLTDIATVDANGVWTPAKFDLGQTWQDVKASRASGTTYTNNTGKPIQVNVSSGPSTAPQINATVGGVSVASTYTNSSGGAQVFASFIVPNGVSYVVTCTAGFSTWAELR